MRSRGVAFLAAVALVVLGASSLVGQERGAELTGSVVSAATGEPIAGAWIALLGWEFGTVSRRDGRFRLPQIPDGPRPYDVEALGYVSQRITLDPNSPDQVIELALDDALQPGLTFLMNHLDDRRRGGRFFDREALAFSGAFDLEEMLRTRGVRGIRKYCLDEVWQPGLASASPEGFYRMEIHGGTARLYSEEFLAETASEDVEEIQRIIRLYQPVC
jgi:hypothetical protein